jgi:hypothetical protein
MAHALMKTATRICLPVVLSAGLVAVCSIGCRPFQPRTIASLPDEYQRQVDVFRISSSFRITDTDQLARELVDLRSAVQTTLHLDGPGQPIDIYIFDDRSRYERFIQTYYPDLPRRRAFFMAQNHHEVVYAFWDDKLIEDLRHEACHALLHSTVGLVPLWLDEGLAEYFETPGESGGLHPRHVAELQASLRNGWHPSLTRLEGQTQLRQMTARDYREAWGWVYWLLNDTPDGRQLLIDYLQEIHAGRAHEPLSAHVFDNSSRPDAALVSLIEQLECTPIVTAGAQVNSREK